MCEGPCRQMRADWLEDMIARDVARVAKITGQAVRHMLGAPGSQIEAEGEGADLSRPDQFTPGRRR